MEILKSQKDSYTEYQFIGKMCLLDDFDDIKECLLESIHNNDNAVVDLTRVTFITSQGLGLLASLTEKYRNAGLILLIFNPREEVMETFSLSGIDKILRIKNSQSEIDEEFEKS